MKNLFKKIVERTLKTLSKRVLKKYKPKIIGITGSVGKTGTRDAIYRVLVTKFKVRRTIGNYNNEIGVPLTIFGLRSPGKSFWGWLKIFLKALGLIIYDKDYPEILVLEMGVDKPKDIDYLVSFAKPEVAVITAISEIPVHVEFFSGPEELAREKSKLAKCLREDDTVLLNIDDKRVKKVKDLTKGKVLTYGFSKEADFRASDAVLNSEDLRRLTEGQDEYQGISYKLHYEENTIPIRMPHVFGRHQVYSSLAAVASGVVFGLNLVEISNALKDFIPPKGRMHWLKGIKDSYIIDDSYNAAPDSTLAALKVLGELEVPEGRKIAALGDMLELGEMAEVGHRRVGREVAEVADILVTVGTAAKFISDEARRQGMSENRIIEFDDSSKAGLFIQNNILREGDLILVKGSQGVRMEKIVKEIMAEPQRAEELLVRQGEEWQSK